MRVWIDREVEAEREWEGETRNSRISMSFLAHAHRSKRAKQMHRWDIELLSVYWPSWLRSAIECFRLLILLLNAWSTSATSSAANLLLLENQLWSANCRGVISSSRFSSSSTFSNFCFGALSLSLSPAFDALGQCERWRNKKIFRKMRIGIYYFFSVAWKCPKLIFEFFFLYLFRFIPHFFDVVLNENVTLSNIFGLVSFFSPFHFILYVNKKKEEDWKKSRWRWTGEAKSKSSLSLSLFFINLIEWWIIECDP